MEERITELEIRQAHLEDTLDTLNNTIIEQHALIEQLRLQVAALEHKLKAAIESPLAHEADETPPPHY